MIKLSEKEGLLDDHKDLRLWDIILVLAILSIWGFLGWIGLFSLILQKWN